MKRKAFFIIGLILLILGISFVLIRYSVGGQQVPVLLYHHFLTEEELSNFDNQENYAVSIESFELQMKYLHDNDYQSITMDQLHCWRENKCSIPSKSFVIAIDDGLISSFRYANEILQKYGYTATLFTITSRITDNEEVWDSSILQYINSKCLNSDSNIDIQSHTHDLHKKINGENAILTKTYDEIFEDIKTSKEITGSKYLAYPFNTYNRETFKALKENDFLLAFRGTNKKTYKNEYKYMISRIFVNNDFEYFKSIFETNDFNQGIFEKVKSDLIYIKKELIG